MSVMQARKPHLFFRPEPLNCITLHFIMLAKFFFFDITSLSDAEYQCRLYRLFLDLQRLLTPRDYLTCPLSNLEALILLLLNPSLTIVRWWRSLVASIAHPQFSESGLINDRSLFWR